MEVILIKKVDKLGNEGDVAKVRDGYARNLLIPQGLALAASKGNFNRLQEIKSTKGKIVQKEIETLEEVKKKIEKISITFTTEAKENEELYGAVSEAQILKLLSAEGVDVKKDTIVIDEPIKKLGVYNLKVNLHQEVCATFRLWVMKK